MSENIIASTIVGSVICLMLLISKNLLLKLMGGRMLYYISVFSMLLFVIPLNINSISLPQMYKAPAYENTSAAEYKAESADNAADIQATQASVKENELVPTRRAPITPSITKTSTPITIKELLITIWGLGFLILLIRYFVTYHSFKKNLIRCGECGAVNGITIVKTDAISSPMVFGYFAPTLAIPNAEIPPEDYELAIQHEMMHFKVHDPWIKLLAVLVNSVCWFNPVTYLMVKFIGEACEYACDEQVTKEMDVGSKQKYSEMILNMVCQASPALSSNMAKK